LSVKRILKPTWRPSSDLSSCEMRVAVARAAMRRGWVWPIRPLRPRPISRQIFGSCVVLPEPVSPQTTTTWCLSIVSPISARSTLTGSASS
jgi:hypothetical protein